MRWPWSDRSERAEAAADEAEHVVEEAAAEQVEVHRMADQARLARDRDGFTEVLGRLFG